MQSSEYQLWCRRFDNHAPDFMTGALVAGLCSEAGEVAGEWEKACRKGGWLDQLKMADELGDTLWNVTRLADELGWTLEQLMEHNINKLIERYEARGLEIR